MFHTPALERFTREAIKAMVASDVAHVSSLQADGRRIAITNVFRVGDRFMSDSVSHDPDPELARFGLGQAELYEMLRTSYAEGARLVDMRAGDFPYKRKWANADRVTRSLVIVAPGKLGELALNERRVAMSLRARRLRRWEKR
jgi:CelD/BcsL family acetyltransferase involved in cellulose biosynthesis